MWTTNSANALGGIRKCCCLHDGLTAGVLPPSIQALKCTYPYALIVSAGAPVAKVPFNQFGDTVALQSIAMPQQQQQPLRRPTTDGTVGAVAATTTTDDTTTPPLKLSAMKLCKLHQEGRCRLGAACRNIHLCSMVKFDVKPPVAVAPPRKPVVLPPIGPLREIQLTSTTTTTCNNNNSDSENAAAGVVSLPRIPVPPQGGRCSSKRGMDGGLVPTPPPSPTACLAKFVRRWNNPLRISSDSNRSASVVRASGESLDIDAIRSWLPRTLEPTPPPPPFPSPPPSARPSSFLRDSACQKFPGFFAVALMQS